MVGSCTTSGTSCSPLPPFKKPIHQEASSSTWCTECCVCGMQCTFVLPSTTRADDASTTVMSYANPGRDGGPCNFQGSLSSRMRARLAPSCLLKRRRRGESPNVYRALERRHKSHIRPLLIAPAGAREQNALGEEEQGRREEGNVSNGARQETGHTQSRRGNIRGAGPASLLLRRP